MNTIALLSVLVLAGCSSSADAQPGVTVVASSSPEARLCQQVSKDIDRLDGSSSAAEFRTFSAEIANDLREVESNVGVDLAIANSYAMLLGIDASAYRDPQQRLGTAVDFVNALDTYVAGCIGLGVAMPPQWVPTRTTNGPWNTRGRSRDSA